MKPNFVSVYEYTEKMCKKAAVYIYYKRLVALVSHILLAVTCIVGTSFTVYYIASGNTPKYHYSTYFFYAVAPIIVEIAVYVKYRMMLKKEMALLREDNSTITVTADNDKLTEVLGGETVGESPLFDVEKVYADKDFFLIMALSGEYFIFKRGCFTEGDEEQFVQSVKGRVKEIHDAAINKKKKK